MRSVLLSCIFVSCLLAVKAQTTVSLIKQEFIMQHPPVPAAHASTITELPGGQLVASWFGGSRESAPDVSIYTSVFSKGKWSAPAVAAAAKGYATWNPVLFTTKGGRLLLFYKEGPSPREWWGLMKYSTDKGRTWSAAEKLPEGILGPIKNKPVQLANGTLLHPSSTESKDEKQWHIHVELSDSTGHNWRKVAIDCDSFGVIQPSALFHPGNRLQLVCRSRQNVIVQTFSDDNGETWIHEGFTKYLESLYTEYVFGKEAATEYTFGNWKRIKNDDVIIGSNTSDRYYKGSAMLHMIRQIIGDSAFKGWFRELNQVFYHHTVNTAQILSLLNNYTKVNFAKIFEQYLHTTQVPVLEYYFQDSFLNYRWSDCVEGFAMPLKVSLENRYNLIYPTTIWQKLVVNDTNKTLLIDRNFYVDKKTAKD